MHSHMQHLIHEQREFVITANRARRHHGENLAVEHLLDGLRLPIGQIHPANTANAGFGQLLLQLRKARLLLRDHFVGPRADRG